MATLEEYIARAIDWAASSTDVISSDSLATVAKRHTLQEWKYKQILKIASVGFLTGLPGGCMGWLLAPLDIAYLFAASGRACYGVGHILGRDIDREADLRLILAIWCGSATAVAGVTAGKLAIKVVGKTALTTMAGFAAKVFAKTAIKGGGKMMTKLLPQIAAKLAGQLAGKAGATLIPLIGGGVSAAISYWVASSMLDAAEQYYKHEYVQFGDMTAAELGIDVVGTALVSELDAEPGLQPTEARHHGLPKESVQQAAPAAELGRSAAEGAAV